MSETRVRLGPLALLFSVISILLTVLVILTFAASMADLRLAEKYADTVAVRTSLEREGQELLAALSAGEDAAFESDGAGNLWHTAEKDGTSLTIGVGPDGKVVCWRFEKEWTQTEEIGNLWDGN